MVSINRSKMGNTKPWTDDDGIMYIGVIPFLLKETGI